MKAFAESLIFTVMMMFISTMTFYGAFGVDLNAPPQQTQAHK